MPGSATFLVVRPYPAAIRRRVFAFLAEQGFTKGAEVPVGTPDIEAAHLVEEGAEHALVLLPYNKHRDRSGQWVTGFGVLRLLSKEFCARRVLVLMPVDEFTYASSFEREMQAISESNAAVMRLFIPMRVKAIGSEEIAHKLRQLIEP